MVRPVNGEGHLIDAVEGFLLAHLDELEILDLEVLASREGQ
jgi:hypothetical protein